MNCNYIQDVMESMGWTDGSYLPIASDENKKLLEEINSLTKSRDDNESILKTVLERADKLTEHFKNAENGIEHNLNLLFAYQTQVGTENHIFKLSERECSKLNQDYKQLMKELDDLAKYDNAAGKEIKRLVRNVDIKTSKIKWANTAMIEWKEAMDKGDETNHLIQKYCKNDESKALALDAKRRTLQDSINKQRSELIEFYEEEKSLEKALDRTANLYRQGHAERRNLVQTWKDAVGQMNQREVDISDTEKDLSEAINLVKGKEMELKQQDDFLQQLIDNNREVEETTAALNNEASECKKKVELIHEEILLKENENQILKKQMIAFTAKLANLRSLNRQIDQEKNDKELEIYKMDNEYTDLLERHKRFSDKHSTAQDRLQMLDDMCDSEQKAKNHLNQETSRLNGILYRSRQQLSKYKDDEMLLLTDLKGLESAILSTKHSIKELEKALPQHIEEDYNLALKSQVIEMKIAIMDGSKQDLKEYIAQNLKLQKLETQAEAAAKQINSFQLEIDKIDADMTNLANSFYVDGKEIDKINDKIQESQRYVEGGHKQIKITTQYNQEKIVELSIMKMRICEMENEISKCNDKVFNLDKHRAKLEKMMEKRMISINSQLEIFQLKRKQLHEERGTLKMDLGERQIKIDALKKRYEVSSDLLGKNEDGTFISPTQIKIEAAQEKQMLLHEGNELNEKVLKAEKEIKAMENTLCLLNFSNNCYKKTFEKLDDQNPEYLELQQLQESYCKLLQRLKILKASLQHKAHDVDECIERREFIEKELDELIKNRTDNSENLMKIHKDLLDQKVKIQRAEREIKCSTKAVRQRFFNLSFLHCFEKDLNLRELEGKNTSCLQSIADLIENAPELLNEVCRLLMEKGLKIPQQVVRKTRSQSDFSDFSLSSKGNSLRLSMSSLSSSNSSLAGKICGAGSSRPSIVSIDFETNLPAEKKRDQQKRPCKK